MVCKKDTGVQHKTRALGIPMGTMDIVDTMDMIQSVHLKIVRENSINNPHHKLKIYNNQTISKTIILIWTFSVKSLGCWKNIRGDELLPTCHGSLGRGNIHGCYEKAKSLGNKVFSVEFSFKNGGCCSTSSTKGDIYKKYGPAINVPGNQVRLQGCRGSQVYEIENGNSLC